MTWPAAASYERTQLRLARHYLGKLRTATAAVHRGQASVAYGLELFDREWGQIKHWQAFAAERCAQDTDWLRLCQEYPLAGLQVLSIRSNLADQARWLESGLGAARQLGEVQAELTILRELSTVYHRLSQLEQSEHFARELLKRGQETRDRLSIGRGYYALGAVVEERGQYPEALEYNQRALDLFTALGAVTDEAQAFHALGSVAIYTAEFQKAHRYFSRHLELMESANNMSEVCRGLLSVAQALLMLEAFGEAEPYLRRAVRLSRRLGYQRLLGAGLIMLAQWAGVQGQIDLELEYYAEGIAASRGVGSQRDVIHGLSNAGLARLLKGDLEGALADLQEGLEMARQAGIPRFIANLQRNLADTYLALHDLERARGALREALALAQDLRSRYQTIKALTSAIGYWQLQGENRQAALWAGKIKDSPEVDRYLFDPICDRLEAALGLEAYHQALEEGQALDLDRIISQVLDELG